MSIVHVSDGHTHGFLRFQSLKTTNFDRFKLCQFRWWKLLTGHPYLLRPLSSNEDIEAKS